MQTIKSGKRENLMQNINICTKVTFEEKGAKIHRKKSTLMYNRITIKNLKLDQTILKSAVNKINK